MAPRRSGASGQIGRAPHSYHRQAGPGPKRGQAPNRSTSTTVAGTTHAVTARLEMEQCGRHRQPGPGPERGQAPNRSTSTTVAGTTHAVTVPLETEQRGRHRQPGPGPERGQAPNRSISTTVVGATRAVTVRLETEQRGGSPPTGAWPRTGPGPKPLHLHHRRGRDACRHRAAGDGAAWGVTANRGLAPNGARPQTAPPPPPSWTRRVPSRRGWRWSSVGVRPHGPTECRRGWGLTPGSGWPGGLAASRGRRSRWPRSATASPRSRRSRRCPRRS